MNNRIRTATMVLSLVFILECSQTSGLTEALAHTLDVDTTVAKTLTRTAQAGSHAIKAVTNYNKTIIESDESNNEKPVTLSTITPDLIIETITWSPAHPSIGNKVTFTVTVKNQGSGKAGYSHVAYYIDDVMHPV